MFLYVKQRHSFTQCQHLKDNSTYQGLIMQVHTPTKALISTDSKTSRISQLALQGLSLGRYEKRTTFLSKQEEYSLIFLVSRGEGFSRLTGGDVVSCSRLWPACLLPPADAWPPAGHAAPGGSCGRWMPGGSRLEEERKRNLTFRCSLQSMANINK